MHLSIKNSIDECSSAEKAFLREAGNMNFYCGLPWVTLLYETCFTRQVKLILCFFYDDHEGKPMACLPMRAETKKLYRLFTQKCLMPLTNFYSCDYGISVHKADIDYHRLARALVNYFIVSEFDLLALDTCFDGKFIDEMLVCGEQKKLLHERYTHFIQRYDIFRDRKSIVIDQFPSKLAHTLTRKGKKAKYDFDVQVHFYEGKTLEQGFLAYNAVYQKAWQKQEPFSGFMSRFVEAANEDNRLLISVLTFNDQPVAAQIWLEWKAGIFAIYKLAFDQAYQKYSPGSLLLHESFDYVLANKKVREIDFGRGDDQYKRDWLPMARAAHGCVLYKRTLLWRLIFIAKRIVHFLKHKR